MKNIGIISPAFVLFALLITADVNAGSVFEGDWSNPNKGAPESIFAFSKLTATFENQTSMWTARFDDGSYFYANLFNYKFSIYNNWGVSGVFLDTDGKRHIGKMEIKRNRLKYSSNSIDFNSKIARQSGRQPEYKFFMDTGNFSADLTYKNIVPAFSPGEGFTWYDVEKKAFLKNVAHCPWGEVSGTIKVDGKTRRVKGQGYADRDHANRLFTRQIKEMHTFRGWPEKIDDGYSISFIQYISGPQYNGLKAVWLVLMKKGEIVMATRDFDVKRMAFVKDDSTGFDYPTRWGLKARSQGKTLTGSWSSSKLVDVLDVFNELPVAVRPIARRFFTRPVFYRMTGIFEGVFNDGSNKVDFKVDGLCKAVYTK